MSKHSLGGRRIGRHIRTIKTKETPLYANWRGMLLRVKSDHPKYLSKYKARGITVCARWYDYDLFCDDMAASYPGPTWTLDRIDNDGNYEPGNCRWATRKTQRRNQRMGTSQRC